MGRALRAQDPRRATPRTHFSRVHGPLTAPLPSAHVSRGHRDGGGSERLRRVRLGRPSVLPPAIAGAAERRAPDYGFTSVRLNARIALEGMRAYYQAHGYAPMAYHVHAGYASPTSVEMAKELRKPRRALGPRGIE
jgi:hypothetical protein